MPEVPKSMLAMWLTAGEVTEAMGKGEKCEGKITHGGGVSAEDSFSLWEIEMEVFGKSYKAGLNKGNLKRLTEAFGSNSDGWVGKKVKLTTVEVLVKGEKKHSLVMEPIK